MKSALRALFGAFLLSLTIGCQSDKVHTWMRADAVEPTDFLPNHRLLVRQRDTFPFHYFYLKQNAPRYEHIYIAPVSTAHLRKSNSWAEFDKALGGKLGASIDKLAVFMRNAYCEAFTNECQAARKLKVVDRRDLPQTLVLESAIIAVVPTKAELNIIGTAASFAVPGLGMVASMLSGGSIMVECRICDAKTGEVIAMYSDTENDPAAVIQLASFTWLQSARINIKTIARHTAEVLSNKDYRTVRRDFPFDIIAY